MPALDIYFSPKLSAQLTQNLEAIDYEADPSSYDYSLISDTFKISAASFNCLRYYTQDDKTKFFVSTTTNLATSINSIAANTSKFDLDPDDPKNKSANSAAQSGKNLFVSYPNQTTIHLINNLSLAETYGCYLASVFFNNPFTKAPLYDLTTLQTQLNNLGTTVNGVTTKKFSEQFIEFITTGNTDDNGNNNILFEIFSQLTSDPTRFNVSDVIPDNETDIDATNTRAFPFMTGDKFIIDIAISGTLGSEKPDNDNTNFSGVTIGDIFGAIPTVRDYVTGTITGSSTISVTPKVWRCIIVLN